MLQTWSGQHMRVTYRELDALPTPFNNAWMMGWNSSFLMVQRLLSVLNDGLDKQKKVSRAISTGKCVVTHFSHFQHIYTSSIGPASNHGSITIGYETHSRCAPRWNSSFPIMQRLLRLRIPLYAALYNDKITSQSDRMKSRHEWWHMEDHGGFNTHLGAICRSDWSAQQRRSANI